MKTRSSNKGQASVAGTSVTNSRPPNRRNRIVDSDTESQSSHSSFLANVNRHLEAASDEEEVELRKSIDFEALEREHQQAAEEKKRKFAERQKAKAEKAKKLNPPRGVSNQADDDDTTEAESEESDEDVQAILAGRKKRSSASSRRASMSKKPLTYRDVYPVMKRSDFPQLYQTKDSQKTRKRQARKSLASSPTKKQKTPEQVQDANAPSDHPQTEDLEPDDNEPLQILGKLTSTPFKKPLPQSEAVPTDSVNISPVNSSLRAINSNVILTVKPPAPEARTSTPTKKQKTPEQVQDANAPSDHPQTEDLEPDDNAPPDHPQIEDLEPDDNEPLQILGKLTSTPFKKPLPQSEAVPTDSVNISPVNSSLRAINSNVILTVKPPAPETRTSTTRRLRQPPLENTYNLRKGSIPSTSRAIPISENPGMSVDRSRRSAIPMSQQTASQPMSTSRVQVNGKRVASNDAPNSSPEEEDDIETEPSEPQVELPTDQSLANEVEIAEVPHEKGQKDTSNDAPSNQQQTEIPSTSKGTKRRGRPKMQGNEKSSASNELPSNQQQIAIPSTSRGIPISGKPRMSVDRSRRSAIPMSQQTASQPMSTSRVQGNGQSVASNDAPDSSPEEEEGIETDKPGSPFELSANQQSQSPANDVERAELPLNTVHEKGQNVTPNDIPGNQQQIAIPSTSRGIPISGNPRMSVDRSRHPALLESQSQQTASQQTASQQPASQQTASQSMSTSRLSQRSRSRSTRRRSIFEIARENSKPTSSKGVKPKSKESPKRYVGNHVFGNYHMLTEEQMKRILNKRKSDHGLDQDQIKLFTLRVNHILEDIFNTACKSTKYPLGFVTFQQLFRDLVNYEILPEDSEHVTFVKMMKELFSKEDYDRSVNILYPGDNSKVLDTAGYM